MRFQQANLFLKTSKYGFECDVDGCSALLCVHILLLTTLLYLQPVRLGNQLLFSFKPRDALKAQDAIDNLSKSEKDLMIQVAQASFQLQLIYFLPKKPGDKEGAMSFLLQVQ